MTGKHFHNVAAAVVTGVAVAACQPAPAVQQPTPAPVAAAEHAAHVVHVRGIDYAFEGPAEIPSGWTTFHFENAGEETHMLFLARLPDGRTFDDYMTGAVVPFNEAWQQLRAGAIGPDEVLPRIGEGVEPWFWETQFNGAVGMLSPGRTGQATVRLAPGNYVMECYMRTADGEMHSMEGMIAPLTVTDARSPGSALRSDIRISMSAGGMEIRGDVPAGTHTFEVHAADHPEGTFGHNLHLLRLPDRTTPQQAIDWLNFVNVQGLTDPSPGIFKGGIAAVPADSRGYFTATLTPGRYLFVSEFTAPLGVWREVTVR